MTWFYNRQPFELSEHEGYYGFVYLITNLTNDKKYVGRKYFTAAGYKQVAGKKKKVRKPSDWEDYYGSNAELQADVERIGKEHFRRVILHLCKTRSECNYFEAWEIFDRHALLKEDYYNSWVTAKVRKDHLKNVAEQQKLLYNSTRR